MFPFFSKATLFDCGLVGEESSPPSNEDNKLLLFSFISPPTGLLGVTTAVDSSLAVSSLVAAAPTPPSSTNRGSMDSELCLRMTAEPLLANGFGVGERGADGAWSPRGLPPAAAGAGGGELAAATA